MKEQKRFHNKNFSQVKLIKVRVKFAVYHYLKNTKVCSVL